MTYRINNRNILPYEPVGNSKKTEPKTNKKPSTSFKDILNNTIQDQSLKISNHAQQRLQQRNVVLSAQDMNKLENAIKKAELKGAKESVLFYKDTAFVTSIKNKTIITAVDSNSAEENIFTNIDSAVIVGSK